MFPKTALLRQLERYRAMTGEQRLAIGLELHALACEIAREGIRQQYPLADDQEIEQHLRNRLRAGRG